MCDLRWYFLSAVMGKHIKYNQDQSNIMLFLKDSFSIMLNCSSIMYLTLLEIQLSLKQVVDLKARAFKVELSLGLCIEHFGLAQGDCARSTSSSQNLAVRACYLLGYLSSSCHVAHKASTQHNPANQLCQPLSEHSTLFSQSVQHQ